MADEKKAPWEKKNPVPEEKRGTLTSGQKAAAKKRAAAAGRPYPNLVDNMAVAKKKKKKKSKNRKPSKLVSAMGYSKPKSSTYS